MSSLRILIVDDHVEIANVFAELLAELGHRAEVCHDGPGAVARAIAAPPDVAFVDIGLPEIDGYEVARRLRSEVSPVPTVIAMTGRLPDPERSRDAGFTGLLLKPFELDTVVTVLASIAPSPG